MLIQEDNLFVIPHSFEQFLFNTEAQVINQGNNFTSFVSLNKQNLTNIRWTVFFIEKDALSPLKSPFGGIEFDDTIAESDLILFITTVEKELIKKGIRNIKLTSPPACYQNQKISMLHIALEKCGYKTLYTDLNQHIIIQHSFESHLKDAARRRFKRSAPLFQFEIPSQPDLHEIFILITNNRQYKGHPLTITLSSLMALYDKFKTSFITFTLRDQNLLIAAAFGIIVNRDIIYYYLPADHQLYKQHSPMIVLIQKMYEYGQMHHMQILDLGVSTEKGVKNEGLIKFKQHLGGEESEKCTFLKQIP